MEVAYMEFAVEIYNDNNFVHQLDVFETLEEAENFMMEYDEMLFNGEYLNLAIIGYDEQGNELELCTF